MTIRDEIGKSLSRLIEAAAKNAIESPMLDNFILSEGSKASQDIANLFADRLADIWKEHPTNWGKEIQSLITELRQGGQE